MECETVLAHLAVGGFDRLDEEVRKEVEDHLSSCQKCRDSRDKGKYPAANLRG